MGHKLTVRNCNPQDPRDCEAYERLKPGAVFGHSLNRPGYQPTEDLFLADVGGAIVGYLDVTAELGIGRVVLDYWVHPSYSPRPILMELLHRALERARKLGARKAHVSVPSDKLAEAELLLSSGFNEVRRHYEFRLEVSEVNLESADRLNSGCRHLEAGGEERLVQIQNRCFAGTWGYNPNTIEDIAWRLRVKGNSPDDVIFRWDGTKLIGYCWSVVDCGQDLSTGRNKGRIYMLGVDPDFRNRGLGRELLRSGLSYLKSKGREIIDITVDSKNKAAVRLYDSEGFQLYEETLWYEKIIDWPQQGSP
jgi:mycothiol synthase